MQEYSIHEMDSVETLVTMRLQLLAPDEDRRMWLSSGDFNDILIILLDRHGVPISCFLMC